jgi:hypothetical protein
VKERVMTVTSDDKTLSVTFTMHLTEPLTEKERDTIIGNLWEHIYNEWAENIPGFVKIAEVDSPDGKYRSSIRDMMDAIGGTFKSEDVSVRDYKTGDEQQQ